MKPNIALTSLVTLALLVGAPTTAAAGDGPSVEDDAGKRQHRGDDKKPTKPQSKTQKKKTVKKQSPPTRESQPTSKAGKPSSDKPSSAKDVEPTSTPAPTASAARPSKPATSPSTTSKPSTSKPATSPSGPSKPATVTQPSKPPTSAARPTKPSATSSGGGHARPGATHSDYRAPSHAEPKRSVSHAQQPKHVAHHSPAVHHQGHNYYAPTYRHVRDHRYARPHVAHLYHHPHAHYNTPSRWWYRGYYSRWWVHPYYRWQYSSIAVVRFTYVVNPWVVTWAPPPRVGYIWMPGYYQYEVWQPGVWEPQVVVDDGAPDGYVWVPGWWEGDVYVDGYWRLEYRTDGDWEWIDGFYYEDGTYSRAHWRPMSAVPKGYTWEPGFWDGESLNDGFWRPQARRDFTWIPAFYDEDGVINTGYWYPNREEPGQLWIPGWFDGNTWTEGYWVDEDEYYNADIENWTPEAGWDAGWEDEAPPRDVIAPDAPLALPLD